MTTATVTRPHLKSGAPRVARNAADPLSLGMIRRDYTIPPGAINEEKRTIELSFSSEDPYERWWGTEILDHGKDAMRLGRLNGGGAVLCDHDPRDIVGVVDRAFVGDDRMGRAIVRFGKSERADEIFNDVKDGIRKLVSVGYRIHKMVLESEKDGEATYRVTDWEPYEVSLVAIPADATVGVGRAGSEDEQPVEIVDPRKGLDAQNQNPPQVILTRKEVIMEPEVKPAPVDQAAIARQTLAAERTRVNEITAMGNQFASKLKDPQELIAKHLNEGTPVDAFRQIVMEQLVESGVLRVAENPAIGMSDKEKRQYSFLRLMAHLSAPANSALREAAAFEIEVSEAARAKGFVERKGVRGALATIPTDMLNAPVAYDQGAAQRGFEMFMSRLGLGGQQRDLVVGTSTAGGNLVATNLLSGSFIDMLVNQMALMQLGTTMLRDLNGNVAIPRQTGGSTAYWVAENGNLTESQQAFDQVSLTPKTVGAFTDYSRQLLLQSSLDVEAFVRMDLARTIAIALDLAGINGSGSSNQPRGVLNTSGIGSVAGGTNGLAPTWDNLVDLETAVANANASIGTLRYLSNTKVRGKLKRTQMFSGTNGMTTWQAVQEQNAPMVISNQVPSNLVKGASGAVCSAIAYGNWADLLFGLWGGLDVLVDPYTGGIAGTTRVIGMQSADFSVRHPESFSAMLDALTV